MEASTALIVGDREIIEITTLKLCNDFQNISAIKRLISSHYNNSQLFPSFTFVIFACNNKQHPQPYLQNMSVWLIYYKTTMA